MDPTSSFFFHPFLCLFHISFFVLLYCNRLRSFRETCDLFFSMSFGLVMITRSQSPHLFPGLCYILFVYSAVFPFLLFTYYLSTLFTCTRMEDYFLYLILSGNQWGVYLVPFFRFRSVCEMITVSSGIHLTFLCDAIRLSSSLSYASDTVSEILTFP